MIKKYYQLREHGYLYIAKESNSNDIGNVPIPYELFCELESFILENKLETENGPTEFLVPGYRRGIGKILKAQNYVGIIQTRNNVVIEILPKVYDGESVLSYDSTIRIFLKMLQYLKDVPFKNFNLSNIKKGHMPLFDIFINMFLEELNSLIKKGLKSGYTDIQENANFYKGKLLFSRHIASNLVHKEKFYIEYNDFNRNRAENRIIKAALKFLYDKTNNIDIQSRINRYLFAMEDVEVSKNIDEDMDKCVSSRLMAEYDRILKWCRIFLKGNSFTNFKGSSVAYALLFPMEKVFESYVAANIKTSDFFADYTVKTQDRRYHLIEKPKKFALKPDIVLTRNSESVILDTKWKLLDDDPNSNYGISQSDLYQMYAYVKKYNSKDVILIYPLNSAVINLESFITYNYESNIRLRIFFIELNNIKESMKTLSSILSDYDKKIVTTEIASL